VTGLAQQTAARAGERLMAARNTDSMQARPRSDAYTGMLVISLLALLVGCLLLYLDYRRYPSGDPPKVIPSTPSTK
jgi:hypothetical protein